MVSTNKNPHVGILCLSKGMGGLELNTIKFAQWLKSRNWDITLFLIADSPIAHKAELEDNKITYAQKDWKYFDFLSAFRLSKKIENEHVDVVLVTNNNDLSLISIVKSFWNKNLKVIYQQHMNIGIDKKDFLHTLRFNSIDAWISPLKQLANEVGEKTNYKTDRVHIIPHGIELEKYSQNYISKADARNFFSIDPEKKIIGIIGRIDKLKGHHFVINALHFINKKYSADIELLIVGEPTIEDGTEYVNLLHSLTKKLGIEDKVHFRGFTDKPEMFYKAIDIFIMASANETFGMVTIEAMASGVPIVATKAGSNPEILENGKLGLLFPPGNEKIFARKVISSLYIEKVSIRTKLAREEAVKIYSHISQCESTEKLVRELI